MSLTLNTETNKARCTKWHDPKDTPLDYSGEQILEIRYFKNDKMIQLEVFFDPKWGKKGCWFNASNNQTINFMDGLSEWRETGRGVNYGA
jgi:hypothetical protein